MVRGVSPKQITEEDVTEYLSFRALVQEEEGGTPAHLGDLLVWAVQDGAKARADGNSPYCSYRGLQVRWIDGMRAARQTSGFGRAGNGRWMSK